MNDKTYNVCIGTVQDGYLAPAQETVCLCLSSSGLATLPQIKHTEINKLEGILHVLAQIDAFIHIDMIIVTRLG